LSNLLHIINKTMTLMVWFCNSKEKFKMDAFIFYKWMKCVYTFRDTVYFVPCAV
jgi:hypothetical protein